MANDANTIAVAVIEDVREVREGLAMLIGGAAGFACVGSYETMEAALDWIALATPDVALSDLGLPGMSGAEGIRLLRERYPSLPVVALTIFRDFRPPERDDVRLTPQEKELLKLLVDGHHYKTAADKMGISRHTVSFHLRNVYAKLEVHSKSEAVSRALRDRLV